MEYEVLKNYTRIGKKEYMAGDIIKHFDGYDFDTAIHFGYISIHGDNIKPKKTLAQAINETRKEALIKEKKAEITKAGPWFKVFDENGKLIEKATRDEEEAKLIKEIYEAS